MRYPRELLEDRGRYATPGGMLLVERHDAIINAAGQINALRKPHGYYLDAVGDPVFLDRGGAVAELDEREAAKQQARAEARADRLAAYQQLPLRPISIENRAGELVIQVGEPLAKSPLVRDAARALFTSRAVVLAELAHNSKKPLHERLPDEPVRPGGGAG